MRGHSGLDGSVSQNFRGYPRILREVRLRTNSEQILLQSQVTSWPESQPGEIAFEGGRLPPDFGPGGAVGGCRLQLHPWADLGYRQIENAPRIFLALRVTVPRSICFDNGGTGSLTI